MLSEKARMQRLGRFSASNAEKLLAKPGSKTYQDFIVEIAREILTGAWIDVPVTFHMQRGIENEATARDEYEARTLQLVSVPEVITSEDDDWCVCTPDGLVGDDGLVEIKCPNPIKHFGFVVQGTTYDEYMAQVQFQLFVTKRAWCDIVTFDPTLPENSKYRLFIERVKPDESYQTKIGEAVQRAKEDVQSILRHVNRETKKDEDLDLGF
jgi:exodeoxyribonuclease (lambda-induced)